jgi:hypothetical protein
LYFFQVLTPQHDRDCVERVSVKAVLLDGVEYVQDYATDWLELEESESVNVALAESHSV